MAFYRENDPTGAVPAVDQHAAHWRAQESLDELQRDWRRHVPPYSDEGDHAGRNPTLVIPNTRPLVSFCLSMGHSSPLEQPGTLASVSCIS